MLRLGEDVPNPHHPLFLGPHGTKLEGKVVKHKGLGIYGTISHAERRRNYPEDDDPAANKTRLWILYPPIPGGKGSEKTWRAGSAFPEELAKRRK